MDKTPMTPQGHKTLKEELHTLKSAERPAVIAAIAEAREHGDLSENAEYHAARERQSFIEGRVKELEAVLSTAEVIDYTQFTGDIIKFGATVTIVDEDTDQEKTVQIVGQYESDADSGKISLTSPVARALIGKSVEDSVSVLTPKGKADYEILGVKYKSA